MKQLANTLPGTQFLQGDNLGGSTMARGLRDWLHWALVAPLMLAAGLCQAELRTVTSGEELADALRSAAAGDTIVLRDGEYTLSRQTLRQSGSEQAPITVQALLPGGAQIRADGVTQFKVYGAHWHFRDLDFQGGAQANHALHIVAGADHTVVEGNRFQNFHAAIKGNGEGDPRRFPDHVRIHRNIFVNDGPRNTRYPLVPIDVVGGKGWQITENFITDIGHVAERRGRNSTAAFVKGGARQAVFDRNVVICEWRHQGGQRLGLAFGSGGTEQAFFDRRGLEFCADNDCPEVRDSRMTNNIILNCPNGPGVYVTRSENVLIAHNTIYDAYGIQARFPQTRAHITHNLLTGTVWSRDGAQLEESHNLYSGQLGVANYLPSIRNRLPETQGHGAEWLVERTLTGLDWMGERRPAKGLARFENWMVAPAFGNLALLDESPIVARGSSTLITDHDFCGRPRRAPADIGALEYKTDVPCSLEAELQRRHGVLFTGLTAPPEAIHP